MTNTTYAVASDYFIWAAIIVLAVAMVAFSVHLAVTGSVRIDGQDQSVSGGNFMWLQKASAGCRAEPHPLELFFHTFRMCSAMSYTGVVTCGEIMLSAIMLR